MSRLCDTYPDIVGFKYPLTHFTGSLKRQRKTRIVAIGSSSTAGEWSPGGEVKIVPFPPRLELSLRLWSLGRMMNILNRGIRGQEAADEMSQFEPDVIAEAPSLVVLASGNQCGGFREGVYMTWMGAPRARMDEASSTSYSIADRRGVDGSAIRNSGVNFTTRSWMDTKNGIA